MAGRIDSGFPGGPRRHTEPSPRGDRPPRIEPVGELEQRVSRRKLERTRKRRTRRIAFGLFAATFLAGSVGAYVGYASHTTPQEVMEAQDAAKRRDDKISSEVNRTLLELWKMEDVESLRNMGRTR